MVQNALLSRGGKRARAKTLAPPSFRVEINHKSLEFSVVFVTGRGGFSLARPRPYTGPTRTHSLDGAPFVTTDF